MTDPPSRPPSIKPLSGSSYGNDAISPTHTRPEIPSLVNGMSVEEEEEGTIKCVCGYQEDDGKTVACDRCNTWQHQACYYQGRPIPSESEPHYCIDCEPGQIINVSHAKQLQGLRWGTPNVEEIRNKKVAKSHKKKVKPNNEPSSTWSDKNEMGSPRNGHSKDTIKKKHKHSSSMHAGSSNAPKLVARRSASHSAQSPSKLASIEVTGEPYSQEFMHLYDGDPGESAMEANLFNNLPVTRELNVWSNDVDELYLATGGKSPGDVFYQAQSIDTVPRPQLRKSTEEDKSRDFHGRHPKWTRLICQSELIPDSFVGELRGKIGLRKDYVSDETNKWNELRHPLPFVFFHPDLPIYIDTRNEGSLVRYVRRSCTGNVVLKTFLEGSDYRFGFVAAKEIHVGDELTLSWTPDEHVKGFLQHIDTTNPNITEQPFDETGRTYIANYFSKVFANFGGCACGDDAPRCVKMIAQKPSLMTNGKKKAGRKPKERPNASRSGSEAIRYKEEDEEDEEDESSGGSKPHSRDMTPQDSKSAIIGMELSEREKRKIAALEKADQDKNQPMPKKKKQRPSGPLPATHFSVSGAMSGKSIPNGQQKDSRPRQVDASTGRKNSGSPINKTFPIPSLPRNESSASSPTVPTSRGKPTYADVATQTDPDPEFDISPTSEPAPRRKFVKLQTRLRMREKEARERMLREMASRTNGTSPSGASSPGLQLPAKDVDGDIVMDNGSVSKASPLSPAIGTPQSTGSPINNKSPSLVPPLHPPPRPMQSVSSNGRNPGLRIPLPSNEVQNGTPATPGIAQSPVVQSPSTLLTPAAPLLPSPSPAKKKLSLAGYTALKRRASTLAQPDTPSSVPSKDDDGDAVVSPTNSAPSVDIPASETGMNSGKTGNGDLISPAVQAPTIDAMDVDTKA